MNHALLSQRRNLFDPKRLDGPNSLDLIPNEM